MNRKAFLILGLVLAAASPPPGEVFFADGVATKQVSLGDLDLARDQDVRTLRKRVKSAVRRVCSDRYLPGALFYERVSCTQDAAARANRQVNAAIASFAGPERLRAASIRISSGPVGASRGD